MCKRMHDQCVAYGLEYMPCKSIMQANMMEEEEHDPEFEDSSDVED